MKKLGLFLFMLILIYGIPVFGQKLQSEEMVITPPSEYGLVLMYRPSQDYQPALSEKTRMELRQPPPLFDWRPAHVSPVKDQGNLGTCYAFATVGEFESLMLIYEDTLYDFSENNIKGGSGQGDGGNAYVNTWYLSMKGYVLEADDPYDDTDPYSYDPNAPFQQRLLGWSAITHFSPVDNNLIKTKVMNNGPVWTVMYAGSEDNVPWRTEFSNYNGSYTLPLNSTPDPGSPGGIDPNHAVLIVGWNDNFPDGKGGWIVKNSWGTGWGDNGYFYIAYNEARIGEFSSIQIDWEDYNDEDEVYNYDSLFPEASLGYNNPTAWQRVTFDPVVTGELYVKKVGFWTNDSADIDVYLYDGSATLLASQTGLSYEFGGYYTVDFTDDEISLDPGDEVKVVVKHVNSSYGFPVTYKGGAAQLNKSEVSADGSSWTVFDQGGVNYGDAAVRLIVGEIDAGIGDWFEY